MSRIFATLALATVIGIATESSATEPMNAVQVTGLIRTDLPGVPWQETQVYVVELAPGAITTNYHQLGHSFVYVLDGTTRLVQPGKPPVVFSAGQAFHEPRQPHYSFENPSRTLPAKVVVFAVLPNDSPYWTQPM